MPSGLVRQPYMCSLGAGAAFPPQHALAAEARTAPGPRSPEAPRVRGRGTDDGHLDLRERAQLFLEVGGAATLAADQGNPVTFAHLPLRVLCVPGLEGALGHHLGDDESVGSRLGELQAQGLPRAGPLDSDPKLLGAPYQHGERGRRRHLLQELLRVALDVVGFQDEVAGPQLLCGLRVVVVGLEGSRPDAVHKASDAILVVDVKAEGLVLLSVHGDEELR
mmetsp:Transcript_65989/g.148908  ORF Transcript_65989/g.148908 Transcript_65989/m.148908 type:complete len:221 (+) Transcript_65989:113-775(+)